MRKPALLVLFPLLALSVLAACASGSSGDEISRERAIELARQHLTFEAKNVEAEKDTENGRPVWRVTFRGQEISTAREMGEVQIVTIDRRTGEMVTLAIS